MKRLLDCTTITSREDGIRALHPVVRFLHHFK
jgi:hypothetical protein